MNMNVFQICAHFKATTNVHLNDQLICRLIDRSIDKFCLKKIQYNYNFSKFKIKSNVLSCKTSCPVTMFDILFDKLNYTK